MVEDARPQSATFVRESVEVAAEPRILYDAISSVDRMGEWSPEATGARIDTLGPIRAGTRFRGSNRKGLIRWTTRCVVIEAVPEETFSFDVTVLGAHVARWGYLFKPRDNGLTLVTETWTDRRTGVIGWVARLAGTFLLGIPDRAKRNRETMRATLNTLKSAMETAESR